jgi:hypothetical protein
MTSAIRNITGVGGDIRKIARLLQKKAPPGHMLAYINQEEADLLKARGGSGRPHEDTGIPSYDEEGEGDAYPMVGVQEATDQSAAETARLANIQAPAPADGTVRSDFSDVYAQPPRPDIPIGPGAYDPAIRQTGAAPTGTPGTPVPFTPPQLQPKGDKDLLGKAAEATGLKEETLQKLGIGGLQALVGAYQANKAQQAGQAGKEEMQAMAAPYRAQAQDIITKAQRGELTPVGQQQLQAVQAQAAQGAEKRGGVAAQQSMAQVEAFRQQLLQQQYDYGLKLSGIADNIALGAIKTGLQADQYVNNLTSNYFTNISRTMYGAAPQTPGTPAGTPGG